MRAVLVLAVCSCLLPLSARAGEILLPDGSPLSQNGGLIILRQGNQTTVSVGGGLLPRRVRVTTATPAGPVVSRFGLPSNFHSPTMPPWLGTAPATLLVDIPDTYGLLYVEGQKIPTEGALRRYLESPPLPPGQDCSVRLRAVFAVGEQILVEDRQVLIRAGHYTVVTFDGSQPVTVFTPPSRR